MQTKVYDKLLRYAENFEGSKLKEAFEYFQTKLEDLQRPVEEILDVVDILLPLNPDEETLMAVLLNDFYMLGVLVPEKVKDNFGMEVFRILDSLKKLSLLNYSQNDRKGQVENLRKMFITLAKDVRVILVWLALRLALMRDLNCQNITDRSVSVSKETMDIYVPIASRLGFYRMKTELEDLAFFYLNPDEYKRISDDMKSYGASSSKMIEHVTAQVEDFLKQNMIHASVSGRIKSIYSIYRKLKRKGLTSLQDLYDFYAIRVVLEDTGIDSLYSFLGLLHSEWKPLSSRFKDYVAVPKPNGYRSLHTVVVGLGLKRVEKPVEIQIRNEEMHREAEYGFASHWIYKSGYKPQVEWVKGLKNLHEFFDASNTENIKGVELDVFRDRIFVLTPRGEIKDLPANSVPIDFAYSVHTDVGNTCVMAKVNSNIVPLDYELNNGDVVEIITRKDAVPKLKWLSVVKTGFAKTKIKNWFNSQNRDQNLRVGRDLLNAQLERIGKPPLDQNYSALKNYSGQNLNLSQRESLVEEIGRGGKMPSDVVRKIYPYERNLVSKPEFVPDQTVDERKGILEVKDLQNEIIVGDETGLPVKFANCCEPRLGSKVVGYVTRGNSITVHQANCKLLDSLNGERLIMARWKGQNLAKSKMQVWIKLMVASRIGLIHDVSAVITDFGINISDISIKEIGSGMNETYMLLDLKDLEKFDLLLDKLENVEGIMKAMRVDGFKH